MGREAAQRVVALLVEAYEAATPLVTDIDRLRARAEAAEAERDRLRTEARHLLDVIEAQRRHITQAPKRETTDDENTRDERDQVFGDAVVRMEATLSAGGKTDG